MYPNFYNYNSLMPFENYAAQPGFYKQPILPQLAGQFVRPFNAFEGYNTLPIVNPFVQQFLPQNFVPQIPQWIGAPLAQPFMQPFPQIRHGIENILPLNQFASPVMPFVDPIKSRFLNPLELYNRMFASPFQNIPVSTPLPYVAQAEFGGIPQYGQPIAPVGCEANTFKATPAIH